MSIAGELTLQSIKLEGAAEWKNGSPGIVFLFLKEGRGRFASRAGVHMITAGDLVVANAGAEGRLAPLDAGGLSAVWFHACLESLTGLFTNSESCHLSKLYQGFAEPRYCSASAGFARDCHALVDATPAEPVLAHRWHLLRVVAAFLAPVLEEAVAGGKDEGMTKTHMLNVLDQLTPAELQLLSVEDLAQRFGCGRRHLNRLFQEHFGTSVAALKMELRLLKAVVLLRNPAAKVINVALECGFTHLGLFNTCFKRRFGLSPTVWRKRNAGVDFEGPAEVARGRSGARTCQLRARGLCPWVQETGEEPQGDVP